MKIQSVSVATIKPVHAPKVGAFALQPSHGVAFSPDLAARLGIKPQARLELGTGLSFLAPRLPTAAASAAAGTAPVGSGEIFKRAELFGKLAEAGLTAVQALHPSATTGAVIEGAEVLVLGTAAAASWADAKGKADYIKAGALTALTGAQLLESLKNVVPAIHAHPAVQTAIKAVTVVLKLGLAAHEVAKKGAAPGVAPAPRAVYSVTFDLTSSGGSRS